MRQQVGWVEDIAQPRRAVRASRPLTLRMTTACGLAATVAIVADIEQGREFYPALFGRDPDFAPHEDFLEWQVLDGLEAPPEWCRSPTSRIRGKSARLLRGHRAQRWTA